MVFGPGQPSSHRLPSDGSLLIGRDEAAEIRLSDPQASRQHARLNVGESLSVEDLGGVNGTFLRDQRLAPGVLAQLAPGDALTIGATTLVVQRRAPLRAKPQIWPYAYFEHKLIEETAQAESAKGALSVARIQFEAGKDASEHETTLVDAIRAGDVIGAYGQRDYVILWTDTGKREATAFTERLCVRLEAQGLLVRSGVASFPEDASSPQALISVMCTRVGGNQRASAELGETVLENSSMREIFALAERAAKGKISVLISGETGVGKEILAQAVHRWSPRSSGPFVCLNCAAVSESLIESELFGHERAAFTGATQARPGLLEAASGGTLFFDEIAEMSLGLQAKVLRAIETEVCCGWAPPSPASSTCVS